VADEPVQQGNHVVRDEEGHQAVGHDHGRPAGGDGVQPGGVGQVGADGVGVIVLGSVALMASLPRFLVGQASSPPAERHLLDELGLRCTRRTEVVSRPGR
jgi:hypothetical protein